jgi:FkbM family methyltransferase
MKITSRIRSLLRNQLGLEVGFAKYFPRSTDKAIYQHYLQGAAVDTIFDVGANIGQTAMAFSRSFPNAAIYSFEPFERNFHALSQAVYGKTNLYAYQLALSNKQGSLEILTDNASHSEWNSIAQHRQESLRHSSHTSKEVVNLETGHNFCTDHKINTISILKTDTEGHDLEVLEGFSDMTTQGRILSVLVEVGFGNDKSHTNFQDINAYLRDRNLILVGFYDISHRSDGCCDYANALFIKK